MARRKPRRWDGQPQRQLLDQLMALYDEVEALYAEHSCPASTECCRFAVTGRQPYVTSIEALAVERAVARRGGAIAPKKRALPLLRGRDEDICPLLGADNRCAIYSARPFGCRTFWCERTSAPVAVKQPVRTQLVRRLQTIAAKHQQDGDRGRPLTRVLRQLGLD